MTAAGRCTEANVAPHCVMTIHIDGVTGINSGIVAVKIKTAAEIECRQTGQRGVVLETNNGAHDNRHPNSNATTTRSNAIPTTQPNASPHTHTRARNRIAREGRTLGFQHDDGKAEADVVDVDKAAEARDERHNNQGNQEDTGPKQANGETRRIEVGRLRRLERHPLAEGN